MKHTVVKIASVMGQLIFLIGLITSAGYYLVISGQNSEVALPIVNDCKLQQQPCLVKLPGGAELEFEIMPKNPDPTQALHLMARLKQLDPDLVSVSFSGKTMNMGLLDYSLNKAVKEAGEVEFNGEGGLSVCVYGRMEWLVTVKIEQNDNIYQIPFEMETNYLPSSLEISGGDKI